MKSLSVKYRPDTFEDVVEQGITTKILNKAVEVGRFKHAYLFAGPSGCGKTTLARIFARKINNVTDPDEKGYEELDAASNNGVEQVRALIDDSKTRSLLYEYKIYIIDECHMITTQGWNAFLKEIEEPSEFTIYIFCTTDPNKVPPQIQNRVQKYNLSRISYKGIYDRLIKICQEEHFTNYEATCDFISKLAQGGMRDAITLLDQRSDLSTDLNIEDTRALFGDLSYESMIRLTNYLIDRKEADVLTFIENLFNKGYDLKGFINSYLECLIDINKYALLRDINLTSIPSYLQTIDDKDLNINYLISFNGAVAYFNVLADKIMQLKTLIKNDTNYKSTIEVMLLNICRR